MIKYDDHGRLRLGPFLPHPYHSTNNTQENAITATHRFLKTYNANGLVNAHFDTDVPPTRWRKLIYNASFNPVSAMLRMDVTRMRVYEHVVDELMRPAMVEILAVAKGVGVHFSDCGGSSEDEETVDVMVRSDPPEAFFRPSMGRMLRK